MYENGGANDEMKNLKYLYASLIVGIVILSIVADATQSIFISSGAFICLTILIAVYLFERLYVIVK